MLRNPSRSKIEQKGWQRHDDLVRFFLQFFLEAVSRYSACRETLQIFLPERRNIVALVRRVPNENIDVFRNAQAAHGIRQISDEGR